MALLDDVRVALRVTSHSLDSEVEGLIAAARRDMARVGVPESRLADGEGLDPLARQAIVLYAKAHFGYDNDEASRFAASYRQVVVDLANSPSLDEGGGA